MSLQQPTLPFEPDPLGAHAGLASDPPMPAEVQSVWLPADVAGGLRLAARGAHYERLIELLDGLASTAPAAANALRMLVERFDYEGLLLRIGAEAEP